MNNLKINFIISIIITIVIIPISFNFFFLWDSGLSKGSISDWFGFYGSIFGGLIGGFFTYGAVILTINNQKREKEKDLRPKIDIPHKNFYFSDSAPFEPIVIELNNIGGSLAKNIECSLVLENYEEVISLTKENQEDLGLKIYDFKTLKIDKVPDIESKRKVSAIIVKQKYPDRSLGGVYINYEEEFIGNCVPMAINYEAKVNYELPIEVSNWINYIVRAKKTNENISNELFDLKLTVKYNSGKNDEYVDTFILSWILNTAISSGRELTYKCILKSKRI